MSNVAVLSKIINKCHQTAVDHGWWDEPVRTFGDQIALMHSELSEALEEFRTNGMDRDKFLYYDTFVTEQGVKELKAKPEGIAVELADVLIRIFDTAAHYKMPLETALLAKMEYNETRPIRHGGKVI